MYNAVHRENETTSTSRRNKEKGTNETLQKESWQESRLKKARFEQN